MDSRDFMGLVKQQKFVLWEMEEEFFYLAAILGLEAPFRRRWMALFQVFFLAWLKITGQNYLTSGAFCIILPDETGCFPYGVYISQHISTLQWKNGCTSQGVLALHVDLPRPQGFRFVPWLCPNVVNKYPHLIDSICSKLCCAYCNIPRFSRDIDHPRF